MVDPRFLEILFFTTAASIIFITLATLCIQFARKKSRYMGPMILAWAATMAMAVFKTVNVWLNPLYETVPYVWLYLEAMAAIFACFATIYLVDSLSREQIEPYKLAVTSCYIGISVYVFFTVPEFGQTFFIYGIQAMMGLVWFYYCIRIYRSATKSLKTYAMLNLIGSCNVFAAIGFGVSGISNQFPGIEWLAVSLGYLSTTIAFVKREQLAFLLPFRVLRLTVVHLGGGFPIFNYNWKLGRELINEDLFSGVMHGIRLIIRESILKGEFREINLDVANIIVQRSKTHPLMAVLVTRKTSRVLRRSLLTFMNRFVEKFQTELKTPNETSQFDNAKELVKDCFNFLPDFD